MATLKIKILSFAATEQEKLLSHQKEKSATNDKQRKKPKCKKCGQFMKGHSASECATRNISPQAQLQDSS